MNTLTEDRRRAIEQSGWGEGFRFVQPHNLAFWVYCLLVVFGAVVLSGQVSIAAAAYSGALTSGIIAFGLLAVAYLWYIHYEDRYTTVPRKLAATGFVGLGFQISENISYAWIGAANTFGDVGAAWGTILGRTLASIPSHWMYTGVFGAGLIWFIGRPDVPARRWLGAGLMLTAMLMHGLWDASAAIAGDNVISIVPGIVALVLISVFIWVYDNSVGIEREWMRELMSPEVSLGVVAPDELEALAGTRTRLKKYIRSRRNPRIAARVLDAETELAHQIARDGGAETDAVQSARATVARARAT
jgi:hypothetical protein